MLLAVVPVQTVSFPKIGLTPLLMRKERFKYRERKTKSERSSAELDAKQNAFVIMGCRKKEMNTSHDRDATYFYVQKPLHTALLSCSSAPKVSFESFSIPGFRKLGNRQKLRETRNFFFGFLMPLRNLKFSKLSSNCMAFYPPETVIIFDVQFFLSKEGP